MRKLLIIIMLLLSACKSSQSDTVYHRYIDPLFDSDGNMVMALNTNIRLSMKNETLLEEHYDAISKIIYEYHMLFDAYHDYEFVNNIKTINDSYGTGEAVTVNKDLFDVLEAAIEFTQMSKGKFNLTIGSLYNVYRPLFSNVPVIMEDPDITQAQACVVDYSAIDDVLVLDSKGQTVTFNPYAACDGKVEISLGAIAKGYITDKVGEYLDDLNQYYLLDVGSSNIYGSSGENFKVGIRSFYDVNDYLYPVSLPGGKALSTSGDNNNYYLKANDDGTETIRSHIIDSKLGYSPNYYRNVTVICESNMVADLMSTVLFLCSDQQEVDDYIAIFSDYFKQDINYSLIVEQAENELKLIYDEGFAPYIMFDYLSSKIINEEVWK